MLACATGSTADYQLPAHASITLQSAALNEHGKPECAVILVPHSRALGGIHTSAVVPSQKVAASINKRRNH